MPQQEELIQEHCSASDGDSSKLEMDARLLSSLSQLSCYDLLACIQLDYLYLYHHSRHERLKSQEICDRIEELSSYS